MHTNWDRAAGGINDTLAECLEMQEVMPLGTDGEAALPRLGALVLPSPSGRLRAICGNGPGLHGNQRPADQRH